MSYTEDSIVELLQSVEILQVFSYEKILLLKNLGEIREYANDSYLMIEHEPSRGMHILLDGIISILQRDHETDQFYRLTTLERGQVIGEISLFDKAPRHATVQADTHTKTFFLSAEAFEGFLSRLPEQEQINFFKSCAVELAERVRSLNKDITHTRHLLWKHALRRTEDT